MIQAMAAHCTLDCPPVPESLVEAEATVASALGRITRPELVIVRSETASTRAAFMAVAMFETVQLAAYTVVAKPCSSQPVDIPMGTVSVVRNPCSSYCVKTL